MVYFEKPTGQHAQSFEDRYTLNTRYEVANMHNSSTSDIDIGKVILLVL